MSNKGSITQKIEETTSTTPEKVFVNMDTPEEYIVQCIQEKKFLIFEHEKGKFRKLPEKIIELLDPITRGSYRASEALNAQHSPEADEFAKHFEVVSNPANPAAPRDKFKVELRGGLASTWGRPDMHEDLVAKGWRPATKDDVLHTKGRAIEGHIEHKTGTGITDTVLYVKDDKAVREEHAKKAEERRALGAALDATAKEKVMSTGYKPVDA